MIARVLDDGERREGPRGSLVYVPGVDGTGAFLFRTARHLAERFRLVRLAYESEPGEACNAQGYATLARSVARCIEEQGLERPILLAESFGVALALRVALDHPGAVGALALVNGFAHYDRRLWIRTGVALSPFLPARLFDLGRRLFVPRALFAPRHDPQVLREFLELPGMRFDHGYRCRLAMIAGVDLRPELGRLDLPVRIFAADRDRVVPSVRAAKVLTAGIPGARVEVLEGTGHAALPFEPERWVARVEAIAAELGR